jgi:2-keto-3-deoxy-L-fuconate dehydrogenase
MKKIAIVTGGSSGIGDAIVIRLLAEDFDVYNLDIAKPPHTHQHANFIQCDLTDLSQIAKAINDIHEKAGRIDVLVSNAGMHYSADIENTSEDIYDKLQNINLKSTFFVLKAVLPIMRKQQEGRIVLMASEQAHIGKQNSSVYGLTKAAIAQLAKSTALDCAKDKVVINAVCPGTINTPLFKKAIENYSQKSGLDLETIKKEEDALQPVNRIGKPEEVAELVCFLCHNAPTFMTGGLIPIDGGYTAK